MSPIDGILAQYDPATGFAQIVSETQLRTSITSNVAGSVALLTGSRSVTVELTATRIYGVVGMGGEGRGKLKIIEAGDDIAPDMITEECSGCVLLGRYGITDAALKRAIELKAAGLILGSISLPVLQTIEPSGRLLSLDLQKWEPLWAANPPLPIVVTEGIGRIRMPDSKYALFESRDGADVSVDSRTVLRGGLRRPEIIFPELPVEESPDGSEEVQTEEPLVWINCAPYAGREGRVINLPEMPLMLETGSRARAAEVAMDSTRLTVPVNDLEIGESN